MWTDRNIRGPDAEHLSPADVVKLLGVSEDYYDERVETGDFPPPIELTRKSKLHPWEHVVFMSLWLRFVQPVKRNSKGE